MINDLTCDSNQQNFVFEIRNFDMSDLCLVSQQLVSLAGSGALLLVLLFSLDLVHRAFQQMKIQLTKQHQIIDTCPPTVIAVAQALVQCENS